MHDQADAHFAGDAGYVRSDGSEVHPRRAEGIRAGVEHRRHQRVLVELAAKVERLAFVPGGPDRPQSEHVLTHARRGPTPWHRVAVLDVRPDLTAEPEDETALRVELQIVG